MITLLVGLGLLIRMMIGYHITRTEVSDYGRWAKTPVKIMASEYSSGSLPEKGLVEKYGTEYYYRFEEAFVGDPNFTVLVTLQIPDTEVYEEQLCVVREKAIETMTVDDQTFYFMNQYCHTGIKRYFDDEIIDGMFYRFEIVAAKEDGTITYLSSYVWDYYSDEVLKAFLQSVPD